MELTVLRPSGVQLFLVAWVELITPVGSFVIQRQHAPMIITLAKGNSLSFVLKSGKCESVYVEHAIAEISREKVIVIIVE